MQRVRRVKMVKVCSVGVVAASVCLAALLMNNTGASGSSQPANVITTIHHVGQNNKVNKPTNTVDAPATVSAAIHNPISTVPVSITPYWTKLPLYTDPNNEATSYYQENPTASGAALIEREGTVPVSEWFGDWDPDVQSAASSYVGAAAQANAVPVLVAYNIPVRDCGSYSAGGAANESAYLSWVHDLSAGIGNRLAVVILEPDALPLLDCLSPADQQTRDDALSQAVTILKTDPNLTLYIDAGSSAWQPVALMAQRLRAANIAQADGFSLNVSHFAPTSQNQAYGDQLSKLVGNKHYIIDTSRNGNNNVASSDWCNPSNAALGSAPTANTGDPLNDAWLWVKIPWESDGSCNGAPAAGMVYWSYAIQMAENAGW
jgi:endoglucanase